MPDRAVRSLGFLETSASTARKLNRFQICKAHGHTSASSEQPLFRTAGLNQVVVIKHRLARNESGDRMDSEARDHIARGREVISELVKRAMASAGDTSNVQPRSFVGDVWLASGGQGTTA